MKRVLRSCIDPLPRFLPTRTLAFVVAVVVFGTALSVHEYVQSGREPGRAWPQSTVQAAERTPSTGASRPAHIQSDRCAVPGSAIDAPIEAARARGESQTKPATLYRPDDQDATGT